MDKLEQIADALHQGWLEYQRRAGRALGPERTPKTQPHKLPWSDLDEESRNQDRFIAAVLLADWIRGALAKDDLPRAIHETWMLWEHLHGNSHPHAQPYPMAHAHGPDEHALQASRIAAFLEEISPLSRLASSSSR